MKWLVDKRYPEAEVIRVVLDNLNTHKPASLYEAFAPEEARRIVKKLEFHYTPKHGSWAQYGRDRVEYFAETVALIDASRMKRRSNARSLPGRTNETREGYN